MTHFSAHYTSEIKSANHLSQEYGRNDTMTTLKITVKMKSGVPLYVQIRDQIKAAIESGRIPAHYRLHTIRELAGILRINPNTVARAYRELEHEGYLETLSGRGTFVVHKEPASTEFEPDYWIVAELEDCFKRIESEWHVPPQRLLHMATQAIERLSVANKTREKTRQ